MLAHPSPLMPRENLAFFVHLDQRVNYPGKIKKNSFPWLIYQGPLEVSATGEKYLDLLTKPAVLNFNPQGTVSDIWIHFHCHI